MSSSVEAIVKPELLVWARESAGLTIEDAARKASLAVEKLESCERGEMRLTVPQLRKLAKVYKRPLAVFYLSKPPKTFDALRDFRRLPGGAPVVESPQLKLEIRRAIYRRKMALEMYDDLGYQPPQLTTVASLADDWEALAERIRRLLSVSDEDQTSFKDQYEALSRWRSAIEDAGALVFQTTGVEVGEMRGFSISEVTLPVIVISGKDSPSGRIFTMLHEFAHLLLRQGGLCNLQEKGKQTEESRVEVFCNGVAGATLVPGELLAKHPLVSGRKKGVHWKDEEIWALARSFQVSRDVILRRLLINHLVTKEFYDSKRERLLQEYESASRSGGFTTPDKKAIAMSGRAFVRLVLNSYYQEKITLSDVSDFLDVRLKWLPQIEKAVRGSMAEVGVAD